MAAAILGNIGRFAMNLWSQPAVQSFVKSAI